MKRFAMVTVAYGLLRSWCWFTFLEGTAAAVMTSMFTLPLHTLAMLFIAGSSVFAVPGALLLRRAASGSGKTRFSSIAGACLLMGWTVLFYPVPHGFAWDVFGTLSASAGFMGLSLLCTFAFFEMGVRRAAVAQCAVSALSVVFLMPWLAMTPPIAAVYIFLVIPLGAAALLLPNPRAVPGIPQRRKSAAPRRSDRTKIARYVGLSLLINLCCGTLHSLVTSARSEVYSRFYLLSNLSYFCCSLVLGWAICRFPRMKFRSICIASIPLMAVGFVLFPLLESRSPLVCFLFIQAGFAFFNVYEWTYILSIAGLFGRATVPLVLGIGMFLWNATTLLGLALPERALGFLGATLTEYPAALSAIAGICLCLAWLLTPDDIVPDEASKPERDVPAIFPLPAAPASPAEYRLTRQETVIVDMLAGGLKNAEMCAALNIAESTLRTHLKNIYRKTGIETRQDLASVGKQPGAENEGGGRKG